MNRELHMKVNIKWDLKMDLESLFGLMEQFMKANSKIIQFMEKVSMYGVMAEYIKVINNK
jgi:hypothetical protein